MEMQAAAGQLTGLFSAHGVFDQAVAQEVELLGRRQVVHGVVSHRVNSSCARPQ
jgi:hypothetical protein